MIKTLNKTILLIIPILLAFSCKKEEERRLDDGTISFYMNGELWQNSEFGKNSGGISSESFEVKSSLSDSNVSILGKIWNESAFYIGLKKGLAQELFEINISNGFNEWNLDKFEVNHINFNSKKLGTFISKKNSGWVKITRFEHFQDAEGEWHFHYEGEFEVTLYNKDDPSDIIEITDGQFNN
jgi:hypothetical protein